MTIANDISDCQLRFALIPVANLGIKAYKIDNRNALRVQLKRLRQP